jgi:hypothetical protein
MLVGIRRRFLRKFRKINSFGMDRTPGETSDLMTTQHHIIFALQRELLIVASHLRSYLR